MIRYYITIIKNGKAVVYERDSNELHYENSLAYFVENMLGLDICDDPIIGISKYGEPFSIISVEL